MKPTGAVGSTAAPAVAVAEVVLNNSAMREVYTRWNQLVHATPPSTLPGGGGSITMLNPY